MSKDQCFFTNNRMASNEVDYVGYYGSDPHIKAYRGIIGLSVANFDVVEEHIYVPRSNYARKVHMASRLLKMIIFLLIIYFVHLFWFWSIILAFIGMILFELVFCMIFKTLPRNLYLYNLSSMADFALFLIPPMLAGIFIPDEILWSVVLSMIILLFVNSFTWKWKKYHLFPYPDKLFSMYEVGFKHGFHPQLDNYLGFVVKPLRWFY